jgi:hypothetical protein
MKRCFKFDQSQFFCYAVVILIKSVEQLTLAPLAMGTGVFSHLSLVKQGNLGVDCESS